MVYMKILFYTCVSNLGSNAARKKANFNRIIDLLTYCIDNLFKSQKYEFDYMLMVGNDGKLQYQFALYPRKIIIKNHKDFKYYERFKNAHFNNSYQDEMDLVYHSKVFIAIEMLEQYDVCIHIDYDFILLNDVYNYINEHKKYDVSSYCSIDRIGTEFIIYYNRKALLPYYDVVLKTPFVRKEESKMVYLHLNIDCLYDAPDSKLDFIVDNTCLKFTYWFGVHISCSARTQSKIYEIGNKERLYHLCLWFLIVLYLTNITHTKGQKNRILSCLRIIDKNSTVPDYIHDYEPVIKTALKYLNIDYTKYL